MRSRTIEFIGAPGVGKSSIYEGLCRKWHPNQNWIYPEALLGGEKPPIARFRDWIEFSVRQILHKKTHHTFSENGGLHYIHENVELANFYWNHFHDSKFSTNIDLSVRFRAIFYLYRDFCKLQAIRNADTDKLCILDEGLLQKSFLVHDDVKIMEDLLDEYLALLPLPRAVIWVDIGDVGEIVKRIKDRRKITASHVGEGDQGLFELSIRWRRMIELITEKLQGYEVKVFKLDSELSLEHNVDEVEKTIVNCSDDDWM